MRRRPAVTWGKRVGREAAQRNLRLAVSNLQGEPAYAELLASFADSLDRMFERDPLDDRLAPSSALEESTRVCEPA